MKRLLTAAALTLATAFPAAAQNAVNVDVTTIGDNVQVFVDVRVVATPQPASQQVQCPNLAGFTGSIQGYQVQSQSYAAASQALAALGLDTRNRPSKFWNEHRGWFASKPTVFYYSGQSAGTAAKLANCLGQLTGYSFVTQMGAGLGVTPGEEARTIFVHLIR